MSSQHQKGTISLPVASLYTVSQEPRAGALKGSPKNPHVITRRLFLFPQAFYLF